MADPSDNLKSFLQSKFHDFLRATSRCLNKKVILFFHRMLCSMSEYELSERKEYEINGRVALIKKSSRLLCVMT